MSRVFAVILAGGEGSRLGGVRKADLRIGGVRMIEQVAGVLAGAAPEIIVSTGQTHDCPLPSPARAAADLSEGQRGPLAGVRAASATLEAVAGPDDLLVFVAVDTPFLPENYLSPLVGAASEHGAAYAAWGDNFYPTNCAWRSTTLRKVLAELDDSSGLKAALKRAYARRVDWRETESADPFANVNTLQDLLALQRRALSR